MQLVTDSGMDLYLPQQDMPEMDVHIVRHTITLDGQTYHSGINITSEELYRKLAETGKFPITSQPSAGDFAAVFKRLAVTDPDILCVNMSSGLSGTVNASQAALEMVPEARVTIIDTKTLSVALGWQVSAAARAIKAGWQKEKIVSLLKTIGTVTNSMYTLDDLKYLIHGGRISHMKGLIASLLNLKPIIGVAKESGMYEQLGQARTLENAIKRLVELITRKHPAGTALRVQVGHALNPTGVAMLRDRLDQVFKCTWLPEATLSPVLGAHTGPSMVGVGFAALADYPEIP